MKYNILVYEQNPIIFEFLAKILPGNKSSLFLNVNYNSVLKNIETGYFDLMIIEIFPETKSQSFEIIRAFRRRFTNSKILAVCNDLSTELAVDCIQSGTDDVLDISSFRLTLEERLQKLLYSLDIDRAEIKKFRTDHKYVNPENAMIGSSKPISEIKQKIKRIVSFKPDIILIEGESGVGKDLLAKIIHQESHRRHFPFIPVNCAAFPESLIDSELFGYEKGAFTGANGTMPGKFEIANKGTLFLDEISEMPLSFQAKLLRVLETKQFYRIGGKKMIEVDLMIIAASNKNLLELIQEEKFRKDIFFRLSKITISIPALKQRKEDIPLLTKHFLVQWNCECHRSITVSPGAMKKLIDYDYPGNVRELKNTLENALIFCSNEQLDAPDIKFLFDTLTVGKKQSDKEQIISILRKNGGNITKSAQMIGYTREGLSKKIKKMEIDKNNI